MKLQKVIAFFMTAAMVLGMVPALTFTAAAETAYTVTNLNDSGSGSLREAIDSTDSGGTIVFQSGLAGTIVLSSQLSISKNLTISGPGASNLTVSGNNACRVLAITGGNVTISGLTVADGKAVGAIGGNGGDGHGGGGGGGGGAAGGGGGILVKSSGLVIITNVNFNNNTAVGGYGGSGGDGWQTDGKGPGGNGGVSDLYDPPFTAAGGSLLDGSIYPGEDGLRYSGAGGGYGGDWRGTGSLGGLGQNNGGDGGPGGNTGGAPDHSGYYGYGGSGGSGGSGEGGAICQVNGCMYVSNCAFTDNQATGGIGGNGGGSNFSLVSGNEGLYFGGSGGPGGTGKGGAIYIGGNLSNYYPRNDKLINLTFSGNSVAGGTGGNSASGGPGQNEPGDFFAGDIYNISDSVSARNLTGNNSNFGDLYPMSAPDAGKSYLKASTYELTAGLTPVTITVGLRDGGSSPIFGEPVTLVPDGGNSTISPQNAVTNADGLAYFTVTDTVAETVTFRAVAGNVTVNETVPIIFRTGGVSAAASTVAANPTVVTADGSAYSTITVSLKDAYGNAIGSGRTIKLTAGSGSSAITPASVVTDGTGIVTFTVADSIAEIVSYSAKVTDGVTLTQTATVNFTQYNWIVNTLEDTNATGTLRYAIDSAPEGTTITFDSSLSGGTITLTSPLPAINKNLFIDGESLGLTVSGGSLYRVFEVNGGTVTIQNISIVNGRSTGATGAAGTYNSTTGAGGNGQYGTGGSGGALLITGGTVSVASVVFSGNSASGGSGGRGADSMDSGLSNSGWAGIGGNGGNGLGGAVCLTGGTMAISNSTFTGNGTSGGSGGNGGDGKDLDGAGGNGGSGLGGAIYASAGTVAVTNTTFSGSSTAGGSGGSCGSGTTAASGWFGSSGKSGNGGNGNGGAVYITNDALLITDCQFSGGSVTAGAKGTGIHGDGSAGSALGTDICSIGGTVTSTNVTLSPGTNSFYNSSSADAGASAVIASPTSVISDGAATAMITVTLKGAGGSLIGSGKTVTLDQGGGHSTITPASAITDSNGMVSFTVKSTRAETVTYTAANATDGVTVAQKAAVVFLPPDDDPSAIETSSDSITADNTEVSTVTVTLKYDNGDPATGKTVSLDQGTGHSSISPASAVTDGSGKAVFMVKSAVAEAVTYKAKITPDNVTMTESVSITFKAYGWNVSTLDDTGNPGSLRYAINNATDGTTIECAVDGILTLTSPLPVINKDLTIDGAGRNITISGNNQYRVFEVSGGTVTFKDLTIANGKQIGIAGANGTYADGSGGAKGAGGGLYITNGTVTLSGVTFKANSVAGGIGGNGGYDSVGNGGSGGIGGGGAVYLAAGWLTVENSIFTNNTGTGGNGGNGGSWNGGANGGNGGNGGNGCGGAIYVNAGSLMLSDSTFNGNTVTYGSGGGYGAWTKNAGSIGSALGCDIYNPGGTVTIADNVTLTPGTNSYINYCYAPDAALSTVTADDTSVMSGNGVYATITVTLIGPGGSSVGAGKTVTLTAGGGNSNITSASAVTDGYGRATFTVTDPYVQNVTYTAKDTSDNVTISQTVAISFLTPDADKSTVTASPASVSSDGTTYSTVSVLLKGADGSPAGGGKAVTLTAVGGSSTITPMGGVQTTDDSGTATFRVTDSVAEMVTYTATDTTDNVLLKQKASVDFQPPDAEKSTITSEQSSVEADGTTYATVIVTLRSASGIPMGSGKKVTLTADPVNSVITPKNDVTDEDGTATFYVTNTNAEMVKYTATDTTDNVTLTNPLTVTFTAFNWVIDNLGDTNSLGTLRYALKNAPSGSAITFQSGLNGTLTLTSALPAISKNLTINGTDANVTISGNSLYRVFEVDSGTVVIQNLTVKDGKNATSDMPEYAGNAADGQGGGFLITGGTITLDHITFSGNSAKGGKGGNNVGNSAGKGGSSHGGAIYISAGTLTILNSIFTGNSATAGNGGDAFSGGNGGNGGDGLGGAIFCKSGIMTISDSQFTSNNVSSGNGGTRSLFYPGYHNGSTGSALGHDLYNLDGTVVLSNVTFEPGTNTYINALPAVAEKSTVSASAPKLPADGITTLIVTVTLKDAGGNSAGSRKAVSLTAIGGTPVITSAAGGLTDANGTVNFTVTYDKPGPVTFTAQDTTDNLTLDQITATFQPPDVALSTISADLVSVSANGCSPSTITIRLNYKDETTGLAGNPAVGKKVTLTAVNGHANIQPVDDGVTDQNGFATFTVTNSYDETVSFKAKDVTDILDLGFVDISFAEYGWVVDTLDDSSTAGTLRHAVANAPAGTTIRFAIGLSGTIKLTSQLPAINRNLTIDGTDANVTISGNNQYRIFEVNGGTVSLKNVIAAKGTAVGSQGLNIWNNPANNGGTGAGGALLVTGGTVAVDRVSFTDNQAVGGNANPQATGWGGVGCGGAVSIQAGSLTVSNCSFTGNNAKGGSCSSFRKGADAYGGAICLESGSITVLNCSFTGSSVKGSPSGHSGENGGGAFGGALYINTGSLTLSSSQFNGNSALGGSGSSNGDARGFDLYNLNGSFSVDHVTFASGGTNSVYNKLPASASKSSVTAHLSAVLADGTAAATITVTLKDKNGSPAGSGKTVNLTPDAGVTPLSDSLTDSSGTATFTATDTNVGTNTYTAVVTPDNISVIQTVAVQFTAYHTVTFTYNNGSPSLSLHVADNTVIGKPSIPENPKRSGYTFGGWYTSADKAWDFTSDSVTTDMTLYSKWIVNDYTVIFDSQSGSTVPPITAAYYMTITAPTDSTRSGYTFGGWYKEADCTTMWDFKADKVTGDMTLYAKWTQNSGGTGGGGGGSSESGSSAVDVETAGGTTTATMTVTTTSDTNGTASASVSHDQISEAVKGALEASSAQGTKVEVKIDVAVSPGTTGISVTLPQSAYEVATEGGIDALTISSSSVRISFDESALTSIRATGSGSVTISATSTDKLALSANARQVIGDRPVYDLTVSSGETIISNFGSGTATISIPYTPGPDEENSKIVVFYISDSGALIIVPNCIYNPSTGMVIFTTTHFSTYAVGYNDISFSDVSGWYSDDAYYLAARDIMKGSGGGLFNPNGSITRAELAQLLYNLVGSPAVVNRTSPFSDVNTTDWHFDAVKWAYDTGIITGNDGKFDPNAPVKRQDIAVMLVRYVANTTKHTLPLTGNTSEFRDNTEISQYALNAVMTMQRAEIISGNSDGSFKPHANATRAEAAKMIATLMKAI